MKEISLTIVPEDPDAQRWYEFAEFAFWLRHPAVLRTDPSTIPEGLVEAQERFRRLGWELTVLESDLTQCINEFMLAFQNHYAEPRFLFLKKFSIVYHTDNFYVRVQKLIDNTWQLVELAAGLQRGPKGKNKPTREEVKTALNYIKCQKIAEVVEHFEENERIKKSAKARHLFVHHYRDESQWPLLNPRRRYEEISGDEDIQAREIRQITETSDLDRYANRMVDEFMETLREIRRLRGDLCKVFARYLIKLVPNIQPEVKLRVRLAVTDLSPQEILERLGLEKDEGAP